MVFTISLIVIGIILLVGLLAGLADRYWFWERFGTSLTIAVIGAVVMTFVIGIGAMVNVDSYQEYRGTNGLRALVTKEATESSAKAVFFLGFGYASSGSTEVTSISYIQTAEDGGNTIRKVDIDNSVIYEDLGTREDPYVDEYVTVYTGNHVWVPWDFWRDGSTEYRFHIPTGTILENYEVSP